MTKQIKVILKIVRNGNGVVITRNGNYTKGDFLC